MDIELDWIGVVVYSKRGGNWMSFVCTSFACFLAAVPSAWWSPGSTDDNDDDDDTNDDDEEWGDRDSIRKDRVLLWRWANERFRFRDVAKMA